MALVKEVHLEMGVEDSLEEELHLDLEAELDQVVDPDYENLEQLY